MSKPTVSERLKALKIAVSKDITLRNLGEIVRKKSDTIIFSVVWRLGQDHAKAGLLMEGMVLIGHFRTLLAAKLVYCSLGSNSAARMLWADLSRSSRIASVISGPPLFSHSELEGSAWYGTNQNPLE